MIGRDGWRMTYHVVEVFQMESGVTFTDIGTHWRRDGWLIREVFRAGGDGAKFYIANPGQSAAEETDAASWPDALAIAEHCGGPPADGESAQ